MEFYKNTLMTLEEIQEQDGKDLYIFKCFCGKGYITDKKLKPSQVSCGCWKRSHLRYAYKSMVSRCYNKKNTSYRTYGKRGIKICDLWLNDRIEFFRWSLLNGWEDGLSLDKIDNNGNYEPSNCQWITVKENSSRPRSRFLQ